MRLPAFSRERREDEGADDWCDLPERLLVIVMDDILIHGDARPVIIFDPVLKTLSLFIEVEGKLYSVCCVPESLSIGCETGQRRFPSATVELMDAEIRVAQSAVRFAPASADEDNKTHKDTEHKPRYSGFAP